MYSFTSRIRYSECDSEKKLSVPSLINYFQDCSTQQSEDIGMGFAYTEPLKCVWVLAAWQVIIHRMPRLGETVEVGTLPYEFKGFLGLRNFFMKDAQGELLAVANSQWTLISTENMKPMKPTERMLECYAPEPKLEMDYAGRKIVLPEEMEALEPFQVLRIHLDSNNHVNNSQFISMASAYLPEGKGLYQFRAEYKVQAHLGDTIVPVVSILEDTACVSLQNEQGVVYCNVEFTFQNPKK
ncbi:MAG: acyl-[Lachnospiraceae bacterium]|nr:acyl-[acyl-carrier-protein] thioesterase [Lachnospiraceae bacterium]